MYTIFYQVIVHVHVKCYTSIYLNVKQKKNLSIVTTIAKLLSVVEFLQLKFYLYKSLNLSLP